MRGFGKSSSSLTERFQAAWRGAERAGIDRRVQMSCWGTAQLLMKSTPDCMTGQCWRQQGSASARDSFSFKQKVLLVAAQMANREWPAIIYIIYNADKSCRCITLQHYPDVPRSMSNSLCKMSLQLAASVMHAWPDMVGVLLWLFNVFLASRQEARRFTHPW